MKIICIGRNYAEHAKELNNPLPAEPVFFMKPDTALLKDNAPFWHPDFSSDIHFEMEMVIRISKAGKHISEEFAHRYYDGITGGIDFTARDLQQKCKEKGLPWEMAKAFDHSAVVGSFIPLSEFPELNNISFTLDVNNQRRQSGLTADMIFSFDQIIAYVSKFVTLKSGDLIFTGTPAGVGKVNPGDSLKGMIENREVFQFEVK
jgi:2-keto-4-pentenoate hydratase/2-oxohepta-3-ene-1,7-dioic acid hydratase in catechol pathway